MTPPGVRLDRTHDPDLVSWCESAQEHDTDFPIQNLPLGLDVASPDGAQAVIAIGDQIVNLAVLACAGLLDGETAGLVQGCAAFGALNPLLASGRAALAALRAQVSDALRRDTDAGARARAIGTELLSPLAEARLVVPSRIGDYTDFYASINHASNVGSMFRPDDPLLPNYKWIPIGYHGRASSIVASGTAIRRPVGQTHDEASAPPVFSPTRRMDYEMEIGAFIGTGNSLGTPISIAEAESHVAGLCLVNDWSARDIQSWEYQPLGPFLSKSFATTVSPWIITLDALAPFRVPSYARDAGDPAPLSYLYDAHNERAGGVDISLEVLVRSARMRGEGHPPVRVSLSNFGAMYWTLAQLVAHHASNGCNLRPGDLLASGTVSGTTKESRGCLLERTWRGTEPFTLPTGERRGFLEDGDEVVMRGWCEREGARRIGFGECRGTVAG